MKRVALLGATGSIGRQAIEIVEAHPELELCAVASGSTPLDDIASPLRQIGGDLTELLDRAEPDVVLNAVVGFAGIHATLWSLERGVESLALQTGHTEQLRLEFLDRDDSAECLRDHQWPPSRLLK